jgi:hypothetical protein
LTRADINKGLCPRMTSFVLAGLLIHLPVNPSAFQKSSRDQAQR